MSNELRIQAAAKINVIVENMEQGYEVLLDYAKEAGEILCEQQDLMDKTSEVFGDWIEAEFDFSKTTAWNWMKLYKGRDKITGAKSVAEAHRMIAPVEDKPVEKKQETPAEEPEPEPAPEPEKPAEPTAPATPKEPATPQKLKTPNGKDVPDDLVEVFERLGEPRGLIAQLNAILKEVRDAVKAKDELYGRLTFNAFETGIKNATRNLRHSMPHAVCPSCGGDRVIGTEIPSQCPCKGTGWCNKTAYEFTPEELK